MCPGLTLTKQNDRSKDIEEIYGAGAIEQTIFLTDLLQPEDVPPPKI
jgi:hypothetical protein